MYLPVPDGWQLNGYAIKTGTAAWGVYYKLISPHETSLTLDNFALESQNVMGNAQTLFIINGNQSLTYGFAKLVDQNDCIQTVFHFFWNGWQMEFVKERPKPQGTPPGVIAHSLFIKATKGDSIRYGFLNSFGTFYQDMYSGNASRNFTLFTLQIPSNRPQDAHLLLPFWIMPSSIPIGSPLLTNDSSKQMSI